MMRSLMTFPIDKFAALFILKILTIELHCKSILKSTVSG